MSVRNLIFLFSTTLLLIATTIRGEENGAEWPQFRGAEQNGAVATGEIFPPGDFALERVWQRPLGSGYSAISIAEGRGVTMFADGTHDLLTAFDPATGRELWRYSIAPMYAGHSGGDDGPSSTPLIVDGVVYGLGPRGDLFAVRLADGEKLWHRRLAEGKDARAPYYGFATAPVAAADLLIVQTGGPAGHAVTAVERKSGETRWSRGDDTVSYQSPALVELDGRRQLVAVTDGLLIGLAPESGELLWQHAHGTDKNEAFAQPLALGDDRLLINSLGEAAVFRIAPDKGGYGVSELWRSDALRGSYALPVAHEGKVYGFNGNFLTALDPRDGKSLWRSRPPGGEGLILVDGHLMMIGGEGDLVVVQANPEGYRERARLKLFERAPYTAPSFAGGLIFARDLETMAAVRIVAKPALSPREE